MTEFGNALVSMLIPEINSTIVASLRDGCTALVKMLRSPEIMQAGEVAAIVKRELSPQMAAITTGLSRMATAVEISIGSPQGAVLGDAATHSTPTYEMLKELRFAMRLQGSRLSQGMDFFHQVAFNVLEMLERERRIEVEHEQTIRLYLKRLKNIRELMNVIISDDNSASDDTTALKKQMVTYLDLVHEAQVEFEAYMASQQNEDLPVFGPDPPPPGYAAPQNRPASPSNTFATSFPAGTFGNPHDEKGVDETFSQAMTNLCPQAASSPPSPACLKDPPEDIPFDTECVVVAQIPDFAQAHVQIVTMIDAGQVSVAQPFIPDQDDEKDLEEEIAMAKALSISELELDDRKPAAKEIHPGIAAPVDASIPTTNSVASSAGSDNESQGVSLHLNAQTEVSNLTTPHGVQDDDVSEATTVVSASAEPSSKPRRSTRSAARKSLPL
jgi:hypothetical protein